MEFLALIVGLILLLLWKFLPTTIPSELVPGAIYTLHGTEDFEDQINVCILSIENTIIHYCLTESIASSDRTDISTFLSIFKHKDTHEPLS